MTKDTSNWLFCYEPKPAASQRLLCIPYSGAGASLFRDWATAMGKDIEVTAVQLPGRETRFREPCRIDFDGVIADIASSVEPLLDKPFSVFGYSLGALLAFGLCRELRDSGMALPTRLFVGAMRAPHTPPVHPAISHLPDDGFVDVLERYYKPKGEAWNNQDLRQLYLPILKNDFSLAENYNYRDASPLECPIDVFSGDSDEGAPPELTRQWAEHTSNEYSYHLFPGGHFFIDEYVRDIQSEILKQLTP